jgi:excisionase family DNA binding protein
MIRKENAEWFEKCHACNGEGMLLRPRLLRLSAAAKYLSVSPGTLRRLIQAGKIPVLKISDGENVPWLIDVDELNQFVEREKVTM